MPQFTGMDTEFAAYPAERSRTGAEAFDPRNRVVLLHKIALVYLMPGGVDH